MLERTLWIEGVQVPRFLYGTAWKEDATQRLTELAVQQGFRGIDTANQRRHYLEAAVGKAIAAWAAMSRGLSGCGCANAETGIRPARPRMKIHR
jgi:diketogulonate reductase-like aldo/keto reductase